MQFPRHWYLGSIRVVFFFWLLLGISLAEKEDALWQFGDTPSQPDGSLWAPPTESSDKASVLALPATEFEFSYLSQLDEAGFGVNTVDVRHTTTMGYGEYPPLSITPGFAIHLWNGPQGLDLPARVYDLSVDFEWQPWSNETSSLLLGSTPGLYGDFESLDSKALQWSGWLAGTHQLNTNWLAMGGVAYVRQLDSNWLPIGGLIWTPNERTRLDILFPRPKITRLVRSTGQSTLSWYLTGHYDGGAWSIQDTPSSHVLVSYSDLRLLTGLEGVRANGSIWKLGFGYAFSRDISVERFSVATPSDALILDCGVFF